MTTTTTNNGEIFIFRIDDNDNIVHVSDNWNEFAKDNDASSSCLEPFVLNRSLWDFISDQETHHLYKIVVEKVRTKDALIRIPFRCDSPDLRRFMEMSIKCLPGNHVEFSSQITHTERRDSLQILIKAKDRAGDYVRICSYCKKIAVPKNEWVDTEKAIELLNLFERAKVPQLTHSVCPECYELVMAELR